MNETYVPPYHEHVPADPAIEDMRKVVVEENIRPVLREEWTNHQVCKSMLADRYKK